MIDDELLQELLVRATGLYNNGDYKGAIAAWREALAVDPSSQKAREGIQMATLLLGDWDPGASGPAEEEPVAPADGATVRPSAQDEADEQRIDAGVKRVRGLIIERKYSEAIEGARGLVPIDPDSEEVQRLVEEAQQAFESAPFIDEHLTLSQELLDQGRRAEAEAECRKVFALDPANPHAHALLATIQGKGAAAPAPEPPEPAGDLGGRTMRIDRSQLQAFQHEPGAAAPGAEAERPDEKTSAGGEEPGAFEITDLSAEAALPPPVEEERTAGAPAADPEPELDFAADVSLDPADIPLDPGAAPSAPDGPSAPPAPSATSAASAPLAADLPEIELDDLSLDAPLEIPEPETPVSVSETMPGLDLEGGAGGPESPDAAPGIASPAAGTPGTPGEPEIVEATTVVPPSVRLVERSPEGQAALDRLMERLDDAPDSIESIPLAVPAAATPAPASPAPPDRAAVAAPNQARPDAGWEQELESLNQKTGAHEIVGRSAARNAIPAATVDEDLDLTALMGDEIGPLQAPAPETGEGPPAEPPQPVASPRAAAERPVPVDRPIPRQRERSAARLAAMAPPGAERQARATTSLFAIAGVVILAVAAVVWWFFFQPRNVAGRSQPPAAAAPPSASSGAANAGDPNPIPTPIGSTSKQTDGVPPEGDANGGGPAEPAPTVVQETAPAPSGSAPNAAAPRAGAAEPAPAPAPSRPRSPEEIRQQTAQHLAAGKAFLAQERWQDARRELAAALALDPVNFECKELLEKAQAKVDQETKVRQEYDEARRLFQDKDYQGALWKLYRLPKDERFGDLDVPIRNAWYNWAIVALKGGDATTATQKLNEVFQVDPADAEAEKMMAVATQYASRAKDRGFYSFVDTLRFRSFDGK